MGNLSVHGPWTVCRFLHQSWEVEAVMLFFLFIELWYVALQVKVRSHLLS